MNSDFWKNFWTSSPILFSIALENRKNQKISNENLNLEIELSFKFKQKKPVGNNIVLVKKLKTKNSQWNLLF